MHPKEFHDGIDPHRLKAALADAERETTGRIYIYVSHRTIEDALAQAKKRFAAISAGHLHERRAGILIYIAPRTHKFAIIGDAAIHDQCGDTFWNSLAEDLSRDLKAGDITAALLNTVSSIRKALASHFPARAL